MVATTAGGNQHYPVPDVPAQEALRLARAAVRGCSTSSWRSDRLHTMLSAYRPRCWRRTRASCAASWRARSRPERIQRRGGTGSIRTRPGTPNL
ncbi:hypothetical protein ACPPVO_02005 [Dactylosporangium sp. McL0621]|uniref:hypothetical protein n=1 Tax=Dactylosporangium sp. McL0621 TaxID=3415678 RepID=UPI003CF4AA49